MNYIYPAVFYPEDDGRYSVIFPDLNDLATYGDNLADAFAMAQEACGDVYKRQVKNISFAFVMTVQCPFCHIKFSCYLADGDSLVTISGEQMQCHN